MLSVKKITTLLFFCLMIVFSGCATTELQTRAIMTRSIFLNPVDTMNKKIYLHVTNTAGSKIDLEPILKKRLIEKGLELVDKPSVATYIMDINVLFANNIKEAYAIKTGLTTGANIGLMTGVAHSSVKNGLVAGAIAAIAGGVVASATEDSIYRAVIDVSVKQRKNDVSGVSKNFSEDFTQQRTRILVSAVKMNLNLKTAIPILENKAAEQIVKIF